MERREFLAIAAMLPLSIKFGHLSKVHLDHVRFIGDFGGQVEEELRSQIFKQKTLFERLLDLTSSRGRPRFAVVSDMNGPELPIFIKSIESNAKFRQSCVGYFGAKFRTENASAKEDIGKRFRLVHQTFPHQRIFTDLDYEEPKSLPQWPITWRWQTPGCVC